MLIAEIWQGFRRPGFRQYCCDLQEDWTCWTQTRTVPSDTTPALIKLKCVKWKDIKWYGKTFILQWSFGSDTCIDFIPIYAGVQWKTLCIQQQRHTIQLKLQIQNFMSTCSSWRCVSNSSHPAWLHGDESLCWSLTGLGYTRVKSPPWKKHSFEVKTHSRKELRMSGSRSEALYGIRVDLGGGGTLL